MCCCLRNILPEGWKFYVLFCLFKVCFEVVVAGGIQIPISHVADSYFNIKITIRDVARTMFSGR